MKYLFIFFIAILLSSCCSTKQAIANTPKQIAKVETPEVIIETTQQDDKESNTTEVILVEVTETDNNENIVLPIEAFNHDLWNNLLQLYVSDTGNVNYKAFKNDITELHLYIDSLGENMPTEDWNKEDKLAYWINAYNAMTVDLILRFEPIKSIKDIKDPWDQRLWKLGDKWYNLNEIEHQILRKMNEPRIHFGIVCASFSCPKLQNEAFTALNLETQLTNATKEFLADTNRNEISRDRIKISKIFNWFSKDFKQNSSLIDFINLYSDVQVSSNAKKSFMDYNWDLND